MLEGEIQGYEAIDVKFKTFSGLKYGFEKNQ